MTRILLPLLVLAGCGAAPSPSAPAPELAAPTEPAPPAPSEVPAPNAGSPEVWTVQAVTNGDAACYVELAKADGTVVSYPSDYRFCPGSPQDATPLVGKKVTATFEKIKVLAAECQGDVDCGKSDEVEGVATLTAVP